MALAVKLRLSLDVAVIALFGYAAVVSASLPGIARHFPLFVSIVGVVAGLGNLAVDLYKWRRGRPVLGSSIESTAVVSESSEDAEEQRAAIRRAATYLAMVLAYLGGIYLVGTYIASAIFLVLFVRWVAGRAWWVAGAMAAVVLIILIGVSTMFGIVLPPGILAG